jgi:2-iminobutanoate/2-iminopropanoate deaminase
MKEFVGEFSPEASFSLAAVVTGPGREVFVAGHVGLGPDGVLVSGGVGPETHATLDGIAAVLESLGGSLQDIVRMGVYLTDLADYPTFAQVRRERFPEGLPASTAVEVSGLLLGSHIEIDCIAHLPLA